MQTEEGKEELRLLRGFGRSGRTELSGGDRSPPVCRLSLNLQKILVHVCALHAFYRVVCLRSWRQKVLQTPAEVGQTCWMRSTVT